MRAMNMFGAVLMLAACSDAPTSSTSFLGVQDVDVLETAKSLRIVGRDAQGQSIGQVSLSLGRFTIDNPEMQGEVDGRQLSVTVLGRTANHESAGYEPLRLPLVIGTDAEQINAFLLDARVSAPLAKWGVTYHTAGEGSIAPPDAPPAPSDTSYASCTYGNSCSASTSCCEYLDDPCTPDPVKYEDICCTAPTQSVFNRACTSPGASTPCGTAGPKGCAVCWSASWASSCSATTQAYWCDGKGWNTQNCSLTYN